ncbi:glycosyltransferase WbuB [Neorhizobium lilium]|uniref:Glycosyltransferase WbuB n=1 Tax=Neorhizobium lilium TaxID=2503024 RepID=A0A3S3VTZ0_9HYPH|nr:glycosyltransferase WbuB [Neorhizobium lilium]
MVFVNRYFHPDQSATSRVLSSLVFSLAERGLDVWALASRDIHNKSGVQLAPEEMVNGVKIRRLASGKFGRHSLLGRSVDYALFHILAFFWLMRNVSVGDMVVVCTDPPLLSVSTSIALRIKGAVMTNWIMDLFPETAIELGFFKHARWLGRWVVKARNWSLGAPGITVCPTEKMAEYLIREGVSPDRVTVMHHWSDGEEIYPVAASENALRVKWGLRDAFVVGYSGNFGRAHDFNTIIEAAQRLRHRSDIRFLLIGGGHQHSAVVEAARNLDLDNLIFKPLQPASDLASSLSVADVHLVSLLPELEHCIIPSKFYGILAAGRPTIFIGDLDGEVPRVLAAKGCGRAVPIGGAQQLAALIEDMQQHPDATAATGQAARRLMTDEYSREHAADAWCALIARMQEAERLIPTLAQGALP